ncbi:MAG: surface lipoprotein assembly modifier [Thermodesulfovibrio sp.]|nr:surface lipoprotein assembly modifier [Thermodesulfovibrio sp.]MCX7723638.1 surface lipoprotein assembly modifier [Thermodesulfovibrio sp.]
MLYYVAFFVSFFLIILIIPSTSAEELFQRGIEQYKKENYEEALEIFKKIYQTQPSTIVSFYLGLTYKQIGDYRNAKDYFLKSLTGIPKINDAYIEVAEVLYYLDQLSEAMKFLTEAEKEFVMPSKVLFLKGLVLSKMGKFNEARYSFEKAKSIDPALTQASDLQIALTYSSERKIKEAMKTLEGLIKIEPKTDIAEFASEYLTALKTAFKQWSITFSLAYQYDDNVVSKPTSTIGVSAVDEISGKKDSAVVSNLRVSYKPLMLEEIFFTGEFGIYTKNYFSSNKFDTTIGTITLTPGFSFKNGFITLPLSYSQMWLNEREYMSVFSFTPTLSIPIYKQNITQITAGYSKRQMLKYTENADPDEDRDSNQYSVSVGYFYPFKEKGILYTKYDYTVDDTQGKNWDSYSHRVSAGIIYPVIDKVSIQFALDHTWQNYRNINTYSGRGVKGFPEKAEKRKDRIYTLTGGFIFDISKTLRMNLSYYHLKADSNFPIYDYRRNIYTAELSLSF